jgi:hypothetical protein
MRLQREPEKPSGMNVQVDIPVLIHKTVVSPAFPSWAIKSLQKAVDAAFLPASPIEVKPSVLLDKPQSGIPKSCLTKVRCCNEAPAK